MSKTEKCPLCTGDKNCPICLGTQLVNVMEDWEKELLQEDAGCVHMLMDEHGIPRKMEGKSLSLVGRVQLYGELCAMRGSVPTPKSLLK